MALVTLKITIYLFKEAEIVLFIIEKVTFLAKYTNFTNIFLKKIAKVLSDQTSIKKHAIKSVDNKQLPYW